jgi:pimeloyl-ACP methyl ester carboxylesterase
VRSLERPIPGVMTVEHELEVPLDHDAPEGEAITLFAREIADLEGRDKPFLVYLQGGPGFESPRPTGPSTPSWLERALRDFRVLMLDQRGTGRSTPVGPADADPERLAHFRADAIVRDCELLREALGAERWSVLGQSFGGLCAATYLSFAPDGLREVLITGGVPTLEHHIDEIVAATYERVRDRERRYFERYPEDRERLAEAVGAPLANGDVLTARRARALGQVLGMSDGFEQLHHLLELDPASPAFAHDALAASRFDRNPLYAVIHEACWADGYATNWAAERMLPDPEMLTGEHVFPWMFEDQSPLAPLRDAAHALAGRQWGPLYDPAQLARNAVPVAAAIYADDMYVEPAFSAETITRIRGARAWTTSEFEHNGLRTDGERVLGRLLDLVRGRA